MSKNNKSDYAILITLGVIFTAIMAVLLFFGVVRESKSDTGESRTSRSSNVEGCLIAYTLFENLSLPVSQIDAMYCQEELKQVGVLILLDPRIPLRKIELNDLQTWIAAGGVLIIDRYPEAIESFCPSVSLESAQKKSETNKNLITAISPDYRNLPLARDVYHLCLNSRLFFKETVSDAPKTNSAVPLLADDRGPRIMEYTYGNGKIIHLCDSSFMTNQFIPKADNALLAVNLASYAVSRGPNKTIAFDEYHQSDSQPFAGLSLAMNMLLTTPAGWAVLVLTAGGLLYMMYCGRQFGPRFPLFSQKHRRSKLEFVNSIAVAWQSCHAYHLTLSLLCRQFHENITARIGLHPDASDAAIAAALARITDPQKQDFYLETLSSCKTLLDKKKITYNHLEIILDKLAKIEKEILNEYRQSQ